MPKVVDHEARRRDISEAVWRVVARRGLEAATVRDIAEEAGVSTGVLSHYFDGKDEILAHALRSSIEETVERVERRGGEVSGMEALRGVLREYMPLDGGRREMWSVWLSFWGKAVHDEGLAGEQRAWYTKWRGVVRGLLRETQKEGGIAEGLDAGREAERLVALVDGIGIQATFEPERLTPEAQTKLLDEHLEKLASLRAS